MRLNLSKFEGQLRHLLLSGYLSLSVVILAPVGFLSLMLVQLFLFFHLRFHKIVLKGQLTRFAFFFFQEISQLLDLNPVFHFLCWKFGLKILEFWQLQAFQIIFLILKFLNFFIKAGNVFLILCVNSWNLIRVPFFLRIKIGLIRWGIIKNLRFSILCLIRIFHVWSFKFKIHVSVLKRWIKSHELLSSNWFDMMSGAWDHANLFYRFI